MNPFDFKNMPLRRKVTATAVAGQFHFPGGGLRFFVANERVNSPKLLERNLLKVAQLIAVNSTGALTFNDLKSGLDLVNSLKVDSHIHIACLYDAKGQVFAKYESPDSEGKPP